MLKTKIKLLAICAALACSTQVMANSAEQAQRFQSAVQTCEIDMKAKSLANIQREIEKTKTVLKFFDKGIEEFEANAAQAISKCVNLDFGFGINAPNLQSIINSAKQRIMNKIQQQCGNISQKVKGTFGFDKNMEFEIPGFGDKISVSGHAK